MMHPLAEDVIASVQKQPLLAELRDMRDDAMNQDRADALTEIIKKVVAGDFDG